MTEEGRRSMSFCGGRRRCSLRAVAESVLQLLMEADVQGLIGAGRHERAADRLNWRNGYRDCTLDTRLGSLNLKIPKLRAGATSRRSWRRARRRKRRWSPSSRRPGSARVDAPGRRHRAGDGAFLHLEEPGLETVQGNRRAREGLPGTSARRRLALSVAGCDLPEGARGRTHRLGRRDIAVAANTEDAARSSGSALVRRKPRPSGRTSCSS